MVAVCCRNCGILWSGARQVCLLRCEVSVITHHHCSGQLVSYGIV